ncbi:MAG: ASCH domain-containing protein [Pseudomonadota bacterium]
MSVFPERALSVRQPWAWAIIHAGKDIENRSWQAVNHGRNVRGRIAIHASKGMTQAEYNDASGFIESLGISCPRPDRLLMGGIIGTVDVVDVVSESDSPWFFGPRGLVLQNPRHCEFIPAKGSLGYFRWSRGNMIDVPDVKPWMGKWAREKSDDPQGALL